MKRAYVIDALRTPVGRFGGSLASVRPDDLAAHVIRELTGRNPAVPVEEIEDVVRSVVEEYLDKSLVTEDIKIKIGDTIFGGTLKPIPNKKRK